MDENRRICIGEYIGQSSYCNFLFPTGKSSVLQRKIQDLPLVLSALTSNRSTLWLYTFNKNRNVKDRVINCEAILPIYFSFAILATEIQ